MSETTATRHSTQALASFLPGLRFEDLPYEVGERTKEFFLDWIASALAGRTRSLCRSSSTSPS